MAGKPTALTDERPATARETLDAEPMVTVRIPLALDAEPDMTEQVIPVQVNGVYMQVTRGDTVRMPAPMYLALRQTGRFDIV